MKTIPRTDQGKTPAVKSERPENDRSDPAIGIIVAIVLATLFWPFIVGLYLYLKR